MVSDQEIAKGVESLLRQSVPNGVTTLNGVVQQLGEKLGLDLTHKTGFIRDQINLLLRSQPQPQPQPQPHPQPQQQQQYQTPKDHFALHSHPQYPLYPQQFPPHFALHPYHHHQRRPPPPPLSSSGPPQVFPTQVHVQPQPQSQPQPPYAPSKSEMVFSQNAPSVTSEIPKESTPVVAKRRGGPGGLNKVCGVSPELQAVLGEPALPRTEIVKQLWAYIRKNNLQDPSNKRKIICDDALRLVFETDCTDMFKMNKLLAKHIIALEPTKASSQAKRVKVEVEPAPVSNDTSSSSVVISEALAKFLGTGEKELIHSEALRRVWEYVKVNHLEDPLNSMVILCDAKLRELLGCESISALGISEMVARHHLFQRS